MYSAGRRELWCMGPETLKVFSQVATCLSIHGNTSKSMALANPFGRLSHSLIRSNARAILSRSYSPTLCSRWMNFVCNSLYCVWLCVNIALRIIM